MPAIDSQAYFKDYLTKLGLFSPQRWTNLQAKGWDTMTTYAFAWGFMEKNQTPPPEVFKQVVKDIEGYDFYDRSTWPTDNQGNPIRQPEPAWHLYRKSMFDFSMLEIIRGRY